MIDAVEKLGATYSTGHNGCTDVPYTQVSEKSRFCGSDYLLTEVFGVGFMLPRSSLGQ
jgi:hypothetical protein